MAVKKVNDEGKSCVKGITYTLFLGAPAILLIASFYDVVWFVWVGAAAIGGVLHDIIQNNDVIAYAFKMKEHRASQGLLSKALPILWVSAGQGEVKRGKR